MTVTCTTGNSDWSTDDNCRDMGISKILYTL